MKVIWFSEIKWNFLTHRHHHLIRHFPPDWDVLFIENFALGKKSHFRPRRDGMVTYVTLPIFKGTEHAWVNAVQNHAFMRRVITFKLFIWTKLILRITGFSGTDLIFTSNIFFADIINRLKKKATVYDCNDFPMGFSGALDIAESYFRKTIEQSDIAIAVSEKLAEDIRKYKTSDVHVIGNGVDYTLFAGGKNEKRPADVADIQKPIAFYAGVVSDWFDFALVEKIAADIPDAVVVIAGPVISPHVRKEVERLSRLPNVRFLGMKPHAELPAYIRASRVCMIPFKKNPLIERFSPNKMYEYLAAGRPVVTMDYTEEIRRLRDRIYVAETYEQFVDMIRMSFKNKADESALQHIAARNSWESKSGELIALTLKKMNERASGL